ncbi:hypothetical protein COLO4_00992 [Corchorus olitorius]|uniref:Uncharacterized protein n=1 Tax=Corchorus olitorius TaxID=93759 RepID=A0A1R3L348_9ROSI|nr:hypothetical protein COLO4_00992 [Corchorus olitorius]
MVTCYGPSFLEKGSRKYVKARTFGGVHIKKCSTDFILRDSRREEIHIQIRKSPTSKKRGKLGDDAMLSFM